ncbi:MAG: Fe-S cluster assembly scaffold protein NifU [Candidatus Saganbacteria bacterium]|nr:Fe-S cluster assembly scaffold protein NifU [Candidatus Saganbacteria bacterium]
MNYSDKVMEHFKNPRNVGEMDSPDGIGRIGNASCGDIMEMYIKVKDNVITDAKFKTFGCAAAIATSSMITEMVKGKSIPAALKLTNQMVVEALDGLPPVKVHCSVLGEDALKSAIDDYLKKTTGKGLEGLKLKNNEAGPGH